MAKKGGSRSKKRLAASKAAKLLRKEHTWVIRQAPGPHSMQASVALGVALRDLIGIARSMREVKHILNDRQVKVDGKVVADYKRPVGLFDLISIEPDKKTYRLLFNRKGQLMPGNERFGQKEKLCKVVAKKAGGKGVVQLTTNDGRTFIEKKAGTGVGDTLLVSVPGQKILRELKLRKGNTALVVGGRRVTTIAKIKEVIEGTMSRPRLIRLAAGDSEFQTVDSNVFVVGEDKPVIAVESG